VYWLLAREVNRLRGNAKRDAEWDVSVDLFFYRDPEELLAEEEADEYEGETAGNEWDTPAATGAAGTDNWGENEGGEGNWDDAKPAPATGDDNWNDTTATATETAAPAATDAGGWEGTAADTPAAGGDWSAATGAAPAAEPEAAGW